MTSLFKLVLDDELIGSRAGDVENQSRNDRKAGGDGDGPVADTIADSNSRRLFRMRLCMKGETEMESILGLFERFPNLKSILPDVRIKFNKWHSKMKVQVAIGSKGYSMSTVAGSSGSGSHQKFTSFSDSDAFIQNRLMMMLTKKQK